MKKRITQYEIPKSDNCKECDYGNCYNENWCECHHPLVSPSRVQISCGCVVKMWMGTEDNHG